MLVEKLGFLDGIIRIEIKNCNYTNKCFIVERRIGIGNKLFIAKKKELPIKFIENIAIIEFNVNNYEKFFMNSTVWDLYLYNTETNLYKRLDMKKMPEFKAEYYEIQGENYLIKPFITVNKELSLYVKRNISIECKSISQNDEKILIEVDTSNLKEYSYLELTLKKRINFHQCKYNNILVSIPIKDGRVEFDKSIFNDINIELTNVFDAFITVYDEANNSIDFPIVYCGEQGKNIDYDPLIRFRYLSTRGNKLSIYFNLRREIELKDFNLYNDICKFNIYITKLNELDINIEDIEIISTVNKEYILKGTKLKDFSMDKAGEYLNISVPLKSLQDEIGGQITLLISYRYNGRLAKVFMQYRLKEILKDPIVKKNEFGKIGISQGKFKEAIFEVEIFDSIKEENEKTKIAVLGSCYSRLPFTSTEYYNKDYKKKYVVVNTQFHSSMISLCEEKPLKFEEKYFSNLPKVNQEYIKVDFEKTYFERLKLSNPDVLIIDLYIEAQKGVIRTKCGSYFTGNFLIEDSRYLLQLDEKDKIILSTDNEYLALWEKSAKKFVNRLKEAIPQEKCILHIIEACDRYKDKDGNIVEFKEYKDFIYSSNLLLKYMYNFLVRLMPQATVVDSRGWNYIADESHPAGLSPNHYESKFYKKLMKTFDKSIAQILLKI